MAPFDYFLIFFAIIIALAVEAVAKDIDTLIGAGRRVKWHWMAPAMAINSILLTLSQFWLLWALRMHSPFNNYLRALAPVATMLALFLAASASLPSEVPDEGLDLKEWYFGNRARFWGLIIALMGCFIVTNVTVLITAPDPLIIASAKIFIPECVIVALLCASLIRWRAVWWHTIVIILLIASGLLSNAGLTLG